MLLIPIQMCIVGMIERKESSEKTDDPVVLLHITAIIEKNRAFLH